MSEKDANSPATTSDAYDYMLPDWSVIETLLAGTRAMREAGEQYLPKYFKETSESYDARLDGAVLSNYVEKTLDSLAGKPFSEELKPGEDIPPKILELTDDIDLQGNKLSVFARDWFKEGFAKAFSHVLIDMPRPKPREDGKKRTLDDDRKENIRPYWVHIKPENILFARAEIENGVEVLKHVRIYEVATEQVGFAEVVKEYIRVLEPGRVDIYRKNDKKKKNSDPDWILDETWDTDLQYIPLVTFYANRKGFMMGKPPLLDLAWLNIAHWRSTSDQRHILSVSRFPILACSGASKDDSDPITVGPNHVLYNEDPQGKFYYVEHSGASIEAGRKDLQDLEEQMSNYGGEFLKRKPGNQTATARTLDSAESTSDLCSMVVVFEDAVAQALSITAEWMRLGSDGGKVELVKQYEVEDPDNTNLEFVKHLRETNDISRKTIIEYAINRGILPEDYDQEADWEQIVDEISKRSETLGAALMDLDPGATDEPEDKNKPPKEKEDE